MNLTTRITLILPFALTASGFAQGVMRGRIMEDDTHPIPFASIRFLNRPGGTVSDADGIFILRSGRPRPNDTLLISSVGFAEVKIPLNRFLRNNRFVLKRELTRMMPVTVRSFRNANVAGARSDRVGYFRSWRTDHTGGEIGREFKFPYREYQLAKVWFKIYSTCDTNILRLHIRDNNEEMPGVEILPYTITKSIYQATDANKVVEFDLEPYNLIMKSKNIFVGIEILKGCSKDSSSCSFSFVGSEPGVYVYKSTSEGIWYSMDDYAIYMRVMFKFDD